MTAATIDLIERRTYIGASEAAAALGLSPWGDPIGLAMEKWGEAEDREPSFRMKLGTMIEPLIGDLYREETGRGLRAGGSRTRRMKGHPWIGAHPDFYVSEGVDRSWSNALGLVQAKLSDDFGDGIPLHYELQGHAELAVTGLPWIDFAVLGARSFQIFRLDRDEEAIADLVADLDDYWQNYIVPKILPPASANSGDALRARYPKHAEKIGKLASTAQAEKLAELARLKAATKAAEEAEKLLANEIKGWIGSAHYIEGDGYRATWSRWESTKVDYEPIAKAYRAEIERVAREQPVDFDLDLDAIESLYTRVEPGQRLTVSTPKENR